MKRIGYADINLNDGVSIDIATPYGTRHDIFAVGASLQVDALSRDGLSVAGITTLADGDVKSIDFAADKLRLTASGGTVTGELRSFSPDDEVE